MRQQAPQAHHVSHLWSGDTPGFVQRQASEVLKGGARVLLHKVYALLMVLPAAFIVLLVRLLRPVALVRFGSLYSERLGHLLTNTELYLCERDAGLHPRNAIDIFYHNAPACNQQVKKMWDRTLRVSSLAQYADRLNRRAPGGHKHTVRLPSDRDIHGLLESSPVHLSFTEAEERRGRAALLRLGIPEGAPFVCFLSRDSAYLESALPGRDWRYHDYRDSTVWNFIPAAEELARRGYFMVRAGAVVNEALGATTPGIIDYPVTGWDEFLDIYLGAKCTFYLGDSCGFSQIPIVFRRPLAIVNMISLEYAPTWGSNYLFIPKRLWLWQERRFMTFREILESGVGRLQNTARYEQFGIEVIENTADEIAALAVEMDHRLKGDWPTTEEDKELQRQFWSLFKPSELNGVFRTRIGSEFLRQNRHLLD